METVRVDFGCLRVARGGCGAKAPPLAARPNVNLSWHVEWFWVVVYLW